MPAVGDIANAIIVGTVLEEIVFRAIVFREFVDKNRLHRGGSCQRYSR